jgi:hypothetical protein
MGLPEWKEAIDCFTADDINLLLLWTAGGFRSKKFPITWQYNRKMDFGRSRKAPGGSDALGSAYFTCSR